MTVQPQPPTDAPGPMVAEGHSPEGPTARPPLSRVWQPLSLGPTTLKNRIVVPARILNYSHTGVLSDRHLGVYRELAEGGPGLIITEQHAAHEVSQGSFFNPCSAWEYAAIPRFEKFADILADNDCRGFVQLFGPGVHDRSTMMVDDWHPIWGVSRIPSYVHGETPLVMEKEHLRDLREGFVRSAKNVQAGGLHGIELHAAHAYLLGQFLSPSYNIRDDEYGGSTENRCRFIVEVASSIREAIGSTLTLGLRMSFDEFLGAAGIRQDEAEAQLTILAGTGLFDYFSISGGGYHTLHMAVPPMGSVDEGFMIPFARRAKEIVGERAAIFTVGRIRDLHLAEEALASGSADAVAMGRAQLADPHIVRKTKEGREREIIRCVGMNECIGRLFDQHEVICAMNPVTGREATKWRQGRLNPVTTPKEVVVVGGGPAGMKFAAVAGARGHRVTLFEASSALGGHLRLLSRMPTREEWARAIDNLERGVENAEVDVRLGTRVTTDSLAEMAYDALVLATGARGDVTGLSAFRPDREGIPGADQDNVVPLARATEQVLDDPLALGQRVVILDESGTYMPLGLAEMLAEGGVDVEVITPEMFAGKDLLRQLDLSHVMPRLRAKGVRITAQSGIESIDGSTVNVFDLWGGAQRPITDVDTIVFAMQRVPNDDLYQELGAASNDTVYRIGDCLAPRQFASLIYDGERLGRDI